MALNFAPIILGVLHIAASVPVTTLQDLEVADDTMSIGSYIREVRAAAPEDFHKSYEHEGDGEIGYSRKRSGGGKKGYQHFDSYHKKAGDNYEFEKQDSYGLEDEGQEGAHSHRYEQRERYREREPSDEEDDDRAHEEKKKKKNKEESDHEDLTQGNNDGNGGIEASGHDPADYTLPEKYTYGTGEEYNF